jgi:hypothetical protein
METTRQQQGCMDQDGQRIEARFALRLTKVNVNSCCHGRIGCYPNAYASGADACC